MDEIKALNDSTGQGINDIVLPTLKIFAPLLFKNKDAIFSIPRKEEPYGPHPRQKLDVYLPLQHSSSSPILVFFYGGGFVRGDKIEPHLPGELVYHNLGSFFAKRGITTIVADYRRVNSELGGEDAVFPSGGEDMSLVLKWLEGFNHKGSGKVIAMGNSAGGLHLSTFLLAPQFLEQRKSLIAGQNGIKLVGAINLGVPFHFKAGVVARKEPLERYYGGAEGIAENCPYGLFEAISRTGKSREETAVPKLLLLLGEFDPVDEIIEPVRDFAALMGKTWGPGFDFWTTQGHNHISPPMALMTGDVEGEKWGEDVAKWIQGLAGTSKS